MNHENENNKRPDTAPESEALETAASEAETPETEAGTPENAAEASVEAAAPEAAEDGSKKEKKKTAHWSDDSCPGCVSMGCRLSGTLSLCVKISGEEDLR